MIKKRVLIEGAGEHASATAHRLFRAGMQVVMTEMGLRMYR
jgi:glutamate dehydrogenase/leucine dehydrogenase